MYWFQLWREFKLSIAEILTVFNEWKTVYFDKNILILDWINKSFILENFKKLWWTIKIFEVKEIQKDDIYNNILSKAQLLEWKFNYWLSIFKTSPQPSPLEERGQKDILNNTKKILKENNLSSRFVNKDFKNLSSAQIIWEKLIEKESDFNLVINWEIIYFWSSICVQDIKEYSDRDYDKDRDMQTWMIPPKLAQIMLNLSQGNIVYDPFVWLWTILIESIIAWNKEIYWSDLNERMVECTINNLKKFINNNNPSQPSLNSNGRSKDVIFEIEKLNAKFIEESEFLKKADAIVTEWYLWEIMTKSNITKERIEKQKESLIKIYEPFFTWLKKVNFTWNIIISFPFWEIKWNFFYFLEIYDIIKIYCNILKLFPLNLDLLETKAWSLLYKRDKQLVGREIFKLKIK